MVKRVDFSKIQPQNKRAAIKVTSSVELCFDLRVEGDSFFLLIDIYMFKP